MNATRIALGGLAAGVFLLASGIALGHGVLGADYVRAFASHRAHPVTAAVIAENTATRLAYGFLAAFLYAAFRPRFGAGPRTAVAAGVFLWVASFLPRLLELREFGILGGWRFAVALGWNLAEALIAAHLAGRLYREGATGGANR